MGALDRVAELQRRGRFREAMETLEGVVVASSDRTAADVLRAELLERTGRYSASRELATRLLANARLPVEHRARCEGTLGLLNSDEGNTEAAVVHFQRAINNASSARNAHLACHYQLRLIVLLADRSGHHSVAPLLAQARLAVTKLGDPVITATLHILMGEIEARRGLVVNSVRHTRLGQDILGDQENLWLSAVAENTLVAVAIMQSDVKDGIERGRRAVRLADESGAAAMRRATLANLGNLLYQTGDFEGAIQHFRTARSILATAGERDNGALDSIALIRMAQGRLDEALEYLSQIDKSIGDASDWLLYGNRHSRMTRAYILQRQGRSLEALSQIDSVLTIAKTVGDRLLFDTARIERASLLQKLGAQSESLKELSEIAGTLGETAPHLHVHYLQIVSNTFAAEGNREAALAVFDRARSIAAGIHSVPTLIASSNVWEQTAGESTSEPVPNSNHVVSILLQNVAALMLHAGRPELVATGLVAILADAGGVLTATARSTGADGSTEILASCSKGAAADSGDVTDRTLQIGEARGRQVDVIVQARNDIASVAALNAVTLLLGTVHDLERARAEREERLTLWPLEDLPQDGEPTIVMGQLAELMSYARRVARTAVSVLITGESGTGKEILARAIHRYSTRADRPFVPFNCAAIPREMLESQLFGHRRGAFTGADRDSPGVIRAAREGTLLLDEIGELSLELQPKLLRFLESGEISPLGEPGPLNVDVRIIAATNANLEQLVQNGRFREDLFYRLNVIRLTIPPLRERRDEIPALVHHFVGRAAQEFGKGRVRVAEETMEHLLLYTWPGNIRQLNNELRRMVALAEPDTVLTPAALSKEILRATPNAAARAAGGMEIAVPLSDKLMPTLSRIEREMIKAALKTNQGKVDAAARALGISRKGLYLKRQRFGL